MTTSDQELERLLGEDVDPDRPAPMLIPWGWRIFLTLLVCFDFVCLLIGRVPWTGAIGLGRGDVIFTAIVGTLLGVAVSMLAEAAAGGRGEALGLTREEARLAADELSVLTRRHRTGRASVIPLMAALLAICWFVASALFKNALLPAATLYVALHALTGLTVPVLFRNFKRANAEFQVWLDEKNAPLDPRAAERAAAHKARLVEVTARIRATEDELRERHDAMARVPTPVYMQPHAVWVIPAMALVLDIVLLFLPEARGAALGVAKGGAFLLIWRAFGLWIQGCIVVGIVWALMSWYYVDIADQISRQREARSWATGGLATYAVEALLLAMIAVALLGIVLLGRMAAPFTLWNLLLPLPILYGVLKDIRDTANEHYDRNVRKRADALGPTPDASGEDDEADDSDE